jgi:hypothetical protein
MFTLVFTFPQLVYPFSGYWCALKFAVYSELPTRLTCLNSCCVLRDAVLFHSCQPYLVKDLYTLFPSLRIPRCHVGMDDTAYTLSSSSNFGIRHQHLLVFHPTFRVRHVCNDQLPLSSHMNSTIQLVTNEVRLLTFKLKN